MLTGQLVPQFYHNVGDSNESVVVAVAVVEVGIVAVVELVS